MSFKIYSKLGKRSYKENKLINKLNSVINLKLKQDPNFINEFEPANNFSELQQLHDRICVEDIQFQEQEVNINEPILQKMETNDDFLNDDSSFVDPLNREEPVVRDYVMNEEFPSAEKIGKAKKTTFDEPVSFEESFELPSDEEEEPQAQNQQRGQRNQGGQRQQRQQRPIQEPLNPSFDEMSNGKKKRTTRKMAKYIVEVVCTLAEKGFVWFANKDINEAKLAEYEISGEIDLSLMLSLEDGQEATVKEFFLVQAMRADQLSKISAEERSDLAESLAEVMLEKGIAPTPMQELILIGVGIFGKQALTLWQISSQNNAVLTQLKALRVETKTPRPVAQPTPQPQPTPQARQEEVKVEKVVEQPTNVVVEKDRYDAEQYTLEESIILDEPINTIE